MNLVFGAIVISISSFFFILCVYILLLPSRSSQRISKLVALFLGVAIFILTIVLDAAVGLLINFSVGSSVLDVIIFLVIGLVIGFGIMGLAQILSLIKSTSNRATPTFILLLSVASLNPMYFYITQNNARNTILIFSVSLLVGLLLCPFISQRVLVSIGLMDKCPNCTGNILIGLLSKSRCSNCGFVQCKNCGTMNPHDESYCKGCSKSLSWE